VQLFSDYGWSVAEVRGSLIIRSPAQPNRASQGHKRILPVTYANPIVPMDSSSFTVRVTRSSAWKSHLNHDKHIFRDPWAWSNALKSPKRCAMPAQTTKHQNTPWSISHGFYGSMGGFAIDLGNSDARYARLFGHATRLTLTAKSVALLAHCGHFPEISYHDIKDRNKADGLAKLLVCIQAVWMIIQVISRTATELRTTLLEVHVVAHVVCALIIYVLWWHNPRQVKSPILLRGDRTWLLAAYVYLASRMSDEKPPGRTENFATPHGH
jgi:hypothetical protein